ncbi:MAG: class I SAM-dependent methyltransferase [Candidatus Latescibacterota bacterium]|nr:MAG: class I SAM-dependent methyltransferase [Candidatus Latescibacterota bacterium]
MLFETIHQKVKGVAYISDLNARYLYELIIREKLTNILELGVAHGTATCYMAAALDEIGGGQITSVDLLERETLFDPSPEGQLADAGLSHLVRIVRMQTGYTWFLHDEIKRLTINDVCGSEYDLCLIDGPKNWTIDGCAFFLVDKILKVNGWIIFDDYLWTYGPHREATDGITHRNLSEEERVTPQIREVFELLVKQHPHYSEFVLSRDTNWAIARKRASDKKTYTIEYRQTNKDVLVAAKDRVKRLLGMKFKY